MSIRNEQTSQAGQSWDTHKHVAMKQRGNKMNWTFFILRAACAVILMVFAFAMNSIFDKVSVAREYRKRTGFRAPELGHPELAQCAKR